MKLATLSLILLLPLIVYSQEEENGIEPCANHDECNDDQCCATILEAPEGSEDREGTTMCATKENLE